MAVSLNNQKKADFGINIFGFLDSDIGLGEAARQVAKGIQSLGIPLNLINLSPEERRGKNKTFSEFSENPGYKINVIVANPDHLHHIISKYKKFLRNSYNIGYWFWELQDLPDNWLKFMNYFDEIWTGSDFSVSVIGLKSSKPVVKMPISVDPSKFIGDIDYSFLEKQGIKNDYFKFLFVFDSYSYAERKNPLGILRAYKEAFKKNEKVQLIIKATKLDVNLKYKKQIYDYIKNNDLKDIVIIDDYLSLQQIASLFKSADCYISLHRAEGVGITIMEAMAVGKPVIVTGYSGNLDFSNVNNSFLVKYKITRLKEDLNKGVHYKKGEVWAEPDIEDAAEKMRFVYLNQQKAAEIGKEGQKFIMSHNSLKKIGSIVKKRLRVIRTNNADSPELRDMSWSREEIEKYSRHILESEKTIGREIGRRIGLIGIFLRDHYPKTYNILKMLKRR